NTVFLKDLKPVEDRRFGPMGAPPPPPGKPSFDKIVPMHEGRTLDHAIFMHPDHELSSDVTYSLGGQFSRFRTEVCHSDTFDVTPPTLTFQVYGDGKQLWEGTVRSRRDKQSCDISVKGVDRLRLVVSSTDHRGAHALWIDPRLEK